MNALATEVEEQNADTIPPKSPGVEDQEEEWELRETKPLLTINRNISKLSTILFHYFEYYTVMVHVLYWVRYHVFTECDIMYLLSAVSYVI